MTPKEIAQKIFREQEYDTAIQLITEAIEAEREACAGVARSVEITEQGGAVTCRLIEDEIHARSGKKIDPNRAPKPEGIE